MLLQYPKQFCVRHAGVGHQRMGHFAVIAENVYPDWLVISVAGHGNQDTGSVPVAGEHALVNSKIDRKESTWVMRMIHRNEMDTNRESFWGHVTQLRKCLIRIALAIGLGIGFSLFISKELLMLLTESAGTLVFLSPAGALMGQLKVALLNGFFISLPVVLWYLGSFLWPALYPRERKALFGYLPAAFLLFSAGLAFGYLVMVRIGYPFLLTFGTEKIRPMISLDTYLAFVLNSMLVCGLVFILPVAMLFLARIGLIKAAFLWKNQRFLILGLTVFVAVITPTVDLFSMILVLLPLLLLVEISIILAWMGERRHKKT